MTSWHDIFSVKHDQFDILISSLKIRHRWQIARQDDRFLNISYREKLNHFHEPNNTIIATKIQIYNPPPTPPYKLEWKPPIYLFHNVMSGQESPVWMWHDYQCYLPQLMFDTRWSMIPGAEKQKRGERGETITHVWCHNTLMRKLPGYHNQECRVGQIFAIINLPGDQSLKWSNWLQNMMEPLQKEIGALYCRAIEKEDIFLFTPSALDPTPRPEICRFWWNCWLGSGCGCVNTGAGAERAECDRNVWMLTAEMRE